MAVTDLPNRPSRQLPGIAEDVVGVTRSARQRPSFLAEVALFWTLLALCPMVAALGPGSVAAVRAHAEFLLTVERTLGVANEAVLHGWLQRHSALSTLAGVFYLSAHVSAVAGTLTWLWFRRPQAFPIARHAFLLTQLMTVTGYLLFPTAPPRHLPELMNGIAPTIGLAERLQYVYAAFPSGHIAFATFVAIFLCRTCKSAGIRIASCAYPILTSVVVVATNNHYWSDVAGGFVVSVLAYRAAATGPRAATSEQHHSPRSGRTQTERALDVAD